MVVQHRLRLIGEARDAGGGEALQQGVGVVAQRLRLGRVQPARLDEREVGVADGVVDVLDLLVLGGPGLLLDGQVVVERRLLVVDHLLLEDDGADLDDRLADVLRRLERGDRLVEARNVARDVEQDGLDVAAEQVVQLVDLALDLGGRVLGLANRLGAELDALQGVLHGSVLSALRSLSFCSPSGSALAMSLILSMF